MKVRVGYTVEVSDGFRRAVRHYYGEDGMATAMDICRWFRQFGDTMNDDLYCDHAECCQVTLETVR